MRRLSSFRSVETLLFTREDFDLEMLIVQWSQVGLLSKRSRIRLRSRTKYYLVFHFNLTRETD